MRELRESKLNVRRQPDDRVEERRRQRLRLIQRKRRLKYVCNVFCKGSSKVMVITIS